MAFQAKSNALQNKNICTELQFIIRRTSTRHKQQSDCDSLPDYLQHIKTLPAHQGEALRTSSRHANSRQKLSAWDGCQGIFPSCFKVATFKILPDRYFWARWIINLDCHQGLPEVQVHSSNWLPSNLHVLAIRCLRFEKVEWEQKVIFTSVFIWV